jgi:hypothetical protein
MTDLKLQHGPQPGFKIVPIAQVALPRAPVLGEHWQALHVLVAEGFTVLELLHDQGMRAEWFFDGAGQHSNTMAPWSDDTRAALRTAFRPALAALRDTLLPTYPVRLHPAQTDALHEFLRLGPGLRDAVTAALQAEVLPDPAFCDLDAPGAAPPPWADPAALRRALAVDLQDRFTAAMRVGALTWPSPVDGADMPCTGAFTLDDFNSLFRFADWSSGLDIFVLATEHLSRVAGLYVPAHGLAVSRGGDQKRMLLQHCPALGRYMLHHLAYFAGSLLAGCAQPSAPARFATFLRGGASAHLGHQLWNELTAIDALVEALPRDRLPEWLVPGLPGNEIEFYGPIDALFPEIAGRVRRGVADQRAVISYAYENRLILFRATREHIGDGLRRRVMAHAARSAPALPPRGRAILVGLRVENRTAADLEGLCALVVEEALRWQSGGTSSVSPGGASPVTIVFDGHNARGDVRSDETISSHCESKASQSPLAIERAVVAAMRQRFAGQPVALLDTLGEPLAASLAWAQACDGFVALWGAGLAKYRWGANKPGLVVTSRWNLENKGDLGLYDAAAYMADPTPLAYVEAGTVRDLPDAPMLVPFAHPSYHNFAFDPDALRGQVRAFLSALDGPPRALAALARRPVQRRGSVDLVDFAVRGWAIQEGEHLVMLDIVIDGAVVGRAACDMPRPDLLAAGFGTATAGFGFVIPPAFLDGAPRLLTVRYADGACLPMLSPNTPDPFAFRLGQAPPAHG